MRDYARLLQALLSDLGIDSSSNHPPITSDMGASTCAKYALAGSFYKKLCPLGNTKSADDAALIKFKAVNQRLAEVPKDFPYVNEAESCFHDYFRDNLRVALTPKNGRREFDLDWIREHMDVGPGAAQKADSRWSMVKLFESPMSYTNEHLIRLYRAAIITTGAWADAERLRFQEYGFEMVEGSKVFFAPKNAEISRTCCTEASLNMLIQKAVCAFLEDCLEFNLGISLSTQADINGELARIGSINGTYGTADLVSASDSIGLQLIKRDFPDGYLKGILMACRSEYAVLPDGSKVELNMISTMGNAFTFPLQTIIFACAVKAVYQLMDIPSSAKNPGYGVFGDDIIVQTRAYDFLTRMLHKLGFEVNQGKSFSSGPFRESCGYDWYSGTSVRGVYVKSLETDQQVYSCFNRLSRWSARHNVPLPKSLSLLKSWARDMRVPLAESDDSGFKVPFCCAKPKVDNSYWFKYRCAVRRIRKITIDCDEETDRAVGRQRESYLHTNKYALTVGFLSGVYRRRDILVDSTDKFKHIDKAGNVSYSAWMSGEWAVSVSMRDKIGARARYKIVTKSVPFWDYLPLSMQGTSEEEREEWRSRLTPASHTVWRDGVVALQVFDL